ncbi:MAG TPA: PilW family protein [Thermoanaerobaculia bacterium]|nr:PilW family protein [Thermoanaerobaculia bacterium]
MTAQPIPTGRREAGFTLTELLVTVLILAVLVLALLAIFDFTGRMTRAQTQIAGMQQVQRVAQHEMVRLVRMAGRGGIILGSALQVRNDRPVDDPILAGSTASTTPRVREGSDVLIVRGIFNSEIYQLDTNNAASFTFNSAGNEGFLTIRGLSPSGVPQDLTALQNLLQADGDDVPEALLVVSAVDDTDYVVVEIDPAFDGRGQDASTSPPTDIITLRYVTDGSRATAYQGLSTTTLNSPTMRTVAYAGIVEEYRYFVRDEAATGVGSPRANELTRARVFPGTEEAYLGDDANLAVTVAENVLDLQVALGLDVDADGVIEEGATTADRQSDEWRFNVVTDTAPGTAFSLVRLTTLVRTENPEPYFEAPRLADIEDRTYEGTTLNTDLVERRYRRWPLQTLVDLRNL